MSGEIPIKQFTFPDGQAHVQLLSRDEGNEASVETAIRSGEELFRLLLVADVLRAHGIISSLYIRYLLGARMDRRIDVKSPFTLDVVARAIHSAGFHEIHVLDPHSGRALDLLGARSIMPTQEVDRVLSGYRLSQTVVVTPDAGAVDRVKGLVRERFTIAQAVKRRDPATGALSGFGLHPLSPDVKGKHCLIIDDICDGGGTFTGLAKVLREEGATGVDLYVTHGIFSKGTRLDGIDHIYTTDSFADWPSDHHLTVYPVRLT